MKGMNPLKWVLLKDIPIVSRLKCREIPTELYNTEFNNAKI